MSTMYRFNGLDERPIQVASDAPLLDFTARFFGLWPFEEQGTAIGIRQVKCFTNMVKQDQRGVKRVTRPG